MYFTLKKKYININLRILYTYYYYTIITPYLYIYTGFETVIEIISYRFGGNQKKC